jgi:SdrD B-like domain/Secretion system C-terminal sorting domain
LGNQRLGKSKLNPFSMKKIYCLGLLLLTLCITTNSFAQISGVVFKDFNGSGVKDNTTTIQEPFLAGITVTAYTATGNQIGNVKTTDAAGAYSFSAAEIPSGTKVRIEFTGIGAPNASSFNGTDNGTNVQFVTAPSTTTNYAVNAIDDYWNSAADATPTYLVVAERRGLATAAGYQATEATIIQTTTATTGPYNPASNNTATTGTLTSVATHNQTGSLFGLASQKKQQRVFASALLKRAVELGPQGPGGIYIMEKSGANYAFTGSFTLEGVTPSNSPTMLNFGTVNRNTTTATDNNFIANNGNFPGESRDNDAFAKATLMSYGDIEADPNSDKIYMINLFQRRLIVFDASAATSTLNNATPATLAPFVTAYNISGLTGSLPGMPAVTGIGNNLRPFAIKIYKGRGYLGVVSDAMATQTAADLRGYILEFDPNNITAGFTTAVTINFNSWPTAATTYWKPWATTGAQAGFSVNTATTPTTYTGPRDYPTPIIAGIEFNEDGSMDIAIRDRWGDQGAFFEYFPLPFATTGTNTGLAGNLATSGPHQQTSINGDLLHVCRVGTNWVVEGMAGSCTQTGANGGTNTNSYGLGYSYGNTGNEWYADRSGDGGSETNEGGITKLMGSNRALSTVYDPMGQGEDVSITNAGFGVYWSTQGVQYNNVTSGVKTQVARIIPGNESDMDKSNGMGDIEMILAPAPIQIGNRIWLDTNGDGVQGADETTAGVPTGTVVTLRSPGPDGNYATTGDNQSWTTTSDANGNYYFSALSSADTRKPATWTGVGNTLLPGYDYRIEVAIPAGYNITRTDVVSNGLDNIDNDATAVGANAIVNFNTGNTNHNFDIGFKTLASLGNRVWLDQGAGANAQNGVQDADEPGVAGVPVNLYRNGADGLPGTADDVLVASTVTDAFGMYMFENLIPTDQTNATTIAATSYNVRVTPPANYSLTTQTNTTDDNNTTGASTTGSDVNALGVSYGINLSPGENNPNIDAGLIFRTPPATNSIGDKVWFDANNDGDFDATEVGVAGVTVTLYDASGNIAAITKTDANGMYLFDGLSANTNYTVGFTAPGGTRLVPTTAATPGGTTTPGNATVNSDPNPITGRTATVNTGVAGTKITGIDAGLQNDSKGAIGDRVWVDAPGGTSNVQDAGDVGVPGVTMTLYSAGADGLPCTADDGAALATVVTDANGNYIFPNLDPGRYYVTASTIAGHSLVTKDAGTDNTIDSDFGAATGTCTGVYVSNVAILLPVGTSGVTRDMTVDLGIRNNTANLNSLGNRVWNDVDKDGLQDVGEASVPNVTVRLLNAMGIPVNNPATGTPYLVSTDANGNYKFVNLADGNYIVEFANIPVGFSFTGQDANGSGAPGSATDTDADSDANTVTGRTGIIDIDNAGTNPASIDVIKVDAGITQGIAAGTASIGNRVWYDNGRNTTGGITAGNANNGVQDAGELGVNNVRVELLDGAGNPVNAPGTATAYIVRTNGLGEYLFTGLPAGQYQVRFSQIPSGFTSSTANTANQGQSGDDTDADANFAGTSVLATTTATSPVYTLQVGEDNPTVDMGIVPAAGTNSLGNFVWYDVDNDGKQAGAATEPGVPGVTVTLYTNGTDGLPGTADDVAVSTTTTDGNGAYQFVGLADGNYNVGFTNLPSGFNFTTKDAATTTAADGSDANQASGRTGTVALDPTSASAAAVNNPDVDGGIVSTRAALGNQVWLDTNGDGILNNGEKGVSGVLVTLYGADGTTVISSTITDADGKYFFANLNAGTYVVGFSNIPANLSFTTQTTPGNTDNQVNNNSDANPTTGKTATVVLSAGETDLTVDAGLRPDNYASVGDFVWVDENSNGVQDAGEPGVPGILVTIYDAVTNLPVGVAVTDGDGKYLVDKLPAATAGTSYYAIFSNLPSTATFTTRTDNVTATDATLGSDPAVGTGRTSNFTLTPGQYLPHVDAGLVNIQLLPLRIVSFTVSLNAAQKANVQWTVVEQEDVVSYEVEYSKDGVSFISVASQTATAAKDANYNSSNLSTQAGANYYRIKAVLANGEVVYSKVQILSITKAGSIAIYPNPVNVEAAKLVVTGTLVGKPATLTIRSINGALVSQTNRASLQQTELINVAQLANGTYIVTLTANGEVISNTRLVVAK